MTPASYARDGRAQVLASWDTESLALVAHYLQMAHSVVSETVDGAAMSATNDSGRPREVLMHFRTFGVALLSAACVAGPATAQTTPAAPAITRTVVAATKLPTVVAVPLHFRAVSVTIRPGEASSFSGANGVLYQMSGSTEVSIDGGVKTLAPAKGCLSLVGSRCR